jgi:outer membrane protein assembly factor BamB
MTRRIVLTQRWAGAAILLFSLVLSGCGGGGGGKGVSNVPTTPKPVPMLSFSPTTASAKTTAGSAASFTVTLNLTQAAVAEMHHLELDDTAGYIVDLQVLDQTSTSYTVEFFTSTFPTEGSYSGTLNWYICKDENCRTTSTGSPFPLAYAISVGPAPPPPPPPPPPPAPVVSPSEITATVEANDTREISVQVDIGTGSANLFGVVDSQQNFAPDVAVLSQAGTVYSVKIRTLPISTPGTYFGTLNLFACNYTPCPDTSQTSTPAAVPYTLAVTPEVLLQPVPTTSGLPEWETYQGNAAHTGYFPATLDATKFSKRWTWTSSGSSTLSALTTGSGKALLTSSGYFSSSSLIALNESDGTVAWQHDFGEVFTANPPATWGGRVFVATSGHEDTAMWGFDLTDGTLLFRTSFDSQWEHYLAPTVKDGYVYTDGGYYGGMFSFKANSGSRRWFTALEQYELWTPAVDDQYAYAYTGYNFVALNRATGEPYVKINNSSFNWRGYSLNISPVIVGDDSVLVADGIFNYSNSSPNHLISYLPLAGTERWRVDGSFASNPVVAAGKAYVLNAASNRLEARDTLTGALLWTWVVPNAQESLPVGNLIVTDNLIFLCTSAATYAIDLTTHQPVWQTPTTGNLAISSNKVLYIVSSDHVDAYALF